MSGPPPTVVSNDSFDPFNQSFTLLLADGLTPISINVKDLDAFAYYNTEVCINYASQLGASLLMLLVVLLITRETKRKTPIFALNVLALALSVIRSLLQLLYWVGPFNEAYAYFSYDYTRVPRAAYANSIASIVMTLLFLPTIEASLLVQVHVVFKNFQNKSQRMIMMMVSVTVALLAIGFRFSLMVQNAEFILEAMPSTHLRWIASASLIMETISIWYFCMVFLGKLIFHIVQQRQMNTKVYRPLQILSIMSGCTMIIPSIFAILEYFPETTFPESGSLALTLVAIMLPLSSTWASAPVDEPSSRFALQPHQKLGSATGHTAQYGSAFDRKGSLGIELVSKNHAIATAERAVGSNGRRGAFSEEEIVGEGSGGVRVEKSYGFQSGH